MAKLFGYLINIEAEGGGRGGGGGGSLINGEVSQSGIQPDGEAASSSAGSPQRETNPYSGFSESGSGPMDSEPDLNHSFIDFFGREQPCEIETAGEFYNTGRNQMQRVASGVDICVMEEDGDIELGLGIGAGAGSGQLRGDSVTRDKGIGSGRVEAVTDLTPLVDDDDLEGGMDLGPFEDDLFCEEEAMLMAEEDEVLEWENSQNDITWESEHVQSSLVELEEEEDEEEEEEEEEDEEEEEEEEEDEEEEEGDELTLPSRGAQVFSPVNSLFDSLFEDFYEESAEDILRDAMEGSSLMEEVDAEFFLDVFPWPGETNHGDYDDVFAESFNQAPPPIAGSRPASKRVVDGLPVVEITSEDLSSGRIVCAICIGDVVVEEKVTRLPCWHYYHGDCIRPWLGMKNTCPVCRFELPTDGL